MTGRNAQLDTWIRGQVKGRCSTPPLQCHVPYLTHCQRYQGQMSFSNCDGGGREVFIFILFFIIIFLYRWNDTVNWNGRSIYHLGQYVCTMNSCIHLYFYLATENWIMSLYKAFRSGCQVYFLLLSRYIYYYLIFFFFPCVPKLVCVSARQSIVYQAFLPNITGKCMRVGWWDWREREDRIVVLCKGFWQEHTVYCIYLVQPQEKCSELLKEIIKHVWKTWRE